jgi:hypothetical protein
VAKEGPLWPKTGHTPLRLAAAPLAEDFPLPEAVPAPRHREQSPSLGGSGLPAVAGRRVPLDTRPIRENYMG